MNNEIKDTLKEEQKKLQALKDVSHLEGVALLISHAKNSVKNCVEILANSYGEKSEQELRSVCATLKANLELYQLMTGLEERITAIEEAIGG